MKRLVLIVMMLIGWVSIFGQTRGQQNILGNRSQFLVERHYIGFPTNNFITMDIEASTLKSKFSQEVTVISVVDYPIGLFVNNNLKNFNNYFSGIEKKIKDEFHGNYILFITLRSAEGAGFQVKSFSSINESAFPSACEYKSVNFNELLNLKLKSENDKLKDNQIYSSLLNTLKEANRILDAGCELTENDEEKIFLAKGYKVFDILDNVTVQNLIALRSSENSKRNTCPIVIDSSRVIIAPSNKSLAEYFFGGSDYLAFNAEYVITSGFTPLSTQVLLESNIKFSACDISVHVHIPNSVYGTSVKKIFLKIRVQNRSPSGWYETYKESLRNKFNLGIYENDNTTEWIFKFKNHKDLITTYLVDDPKYILSQNAAYVGLICGFADSFLRDMQFLANITILQDGVRESVWLFNHYTMQVIMGNESGANAELQFRTYIHEMIKSSDVASFGNNFSDIDQAITIFIETLKNALGDQWDKMQFRDSSFDFGYAAGESVYVALGIKALVVDSGKGILALSKGVNKSLLTATNSVKGSVTGEKVYDAIRNTSLILEATEVLNMLNNKWWAKCLYRKKAWSNELTDELTTLVNEFKFSFEQYGPKLGDFGPSPLGKYFDKTMEGIIKAGWENGNFTGLSDEVAQALNSLRSEYDLLIKPKVSINGRTPEPDLLFVKRKLDGTLDYDDAIFIDNKYHIETKFTGAQKEIATAVKDPSKGNEAVVKFVSGDPTLGLKTVPIDQIIKIKQVRVFSIDDFLNLLVVQY